MSKEAVEQARKSFDRAEQVAALNDLIARIRYSHRHNPENCPPGLPLPLPAGAGPAEIEAAYGALEALPLHQLVRGLCEPMNGAFPAEPVVRVLTRSLGEGAELERRYRVNTGVPAAS
jgi:hypothetical protein